MKCAEREFKIYDGERPKVLLLGNGLCRAYDGMSWDKLLDEIKDRELFPQAARNYAMPMPLKAAMLANNTLADKLRRIVTEGKTADTQTESIDWGSFIKTTVHMREQIKKLINCDFDYVLTTNYSYEIEAALLDKENPSPEDITKLMNFYEVDYAQKKFLTNTFNLVENVPIWHIHGEARKPDSIVLGHYYYGKLLRRCVARLDGTKEIIEGQKSAYHGKEQEFKRNLRTKRPQKIGSWIDAFVLGNVYILGFGMDFSEADLWWLVEYKSNNKEFCGKTIFYDPEKAENANCVLDGNLACDKLADYVLSAQCKHLLMNKTYNVEIKTLGMTIQSNSDYKDFYTRAIDDISKSR